MRHSPKKMALVSLGVACVLSLSFGVAAETDTSELVSFGEKVSYSMGQKIGRTMKGEMAVKSDLFTLKTDLFIQGIRDVLSDKEPRLSDEEMKDLLKTYVAKKKEAEEKRVAEQAEKNLQEGERFLAENATNKGVVVLPGGLQYKVIKSGSGKTPGEKDQVSAHYRGTFVDGTEFGNTYSKGQPARFRVDGVIAGWSEALQLMKEGDKWQLFIPANLAYGEDGRMPSIEPNKTLIFDVELVAVDTKEAAPEKSDSGS